MPQPNALRPAVRLLAALMLAAVLPPATLHAALASAAGTMFEAAPFVLAASLFRGKSLRGLVGLASCGCVRGVPGALSLPATALCWLAFGPWVASARLAAALLLVARARRFHSAEPSVNARPLTELAAIGVAAGLASPALEFVQSLPAHHVAPAVALAAGFAGGTLVGCALPCTSAALAVAAALRSVAPAASFAILLTAGLATAGGLGSRLGPARALQHPRDSDASRGGDSFALAVLAAACAGLALRGGAGLISPRLVPLVAAAAPLAVIRALRQGGDAPAFRLVPAGLIAALALGSPPPAYVASETTLSDAFPGEHLTFVGVAHRSGSSTILQRFVITCCRADAVAVTVRTLRPLPVPDGAWLEAKGEVVGSSIGPALDVARWRRLSAPSDPFAYR